MEQVGQNDNSPFEVRNYAVAFLDLLGQQDIFAGCGLLPKFNNTKEQDDFISVLKKSIGAVHDLQTSCEEMFNNYCNQGNSRKSEIPKKSTNYTTRLRK
jgi:flagellar hook-basal body complex protein FliE